MKSKLAARLLVTVLPRITSDLDAAGQALERADLVGAVRWIARAEGRLEYLLFDSGAFPVVRAARKAARGLSRGRASRGSPQPTRKLSSAQSTKPGHKNKEAK